MVTAFRGFPFFNLLVLNMEGLLSTVNFLASCGKPTHECHDDISFNVTMQGGFKQELYTAF